MPRNATVSSGRFWVSIMQCTSHFTGAQLIDELKSRDRKTPDEAKSWIEEKTGYRFDSQAMYKLRWPQHERSDTWSGYSGLKIHIMNDHELATLEDEYRKYNKKPPRKPWEPFMYEASMGRAKAAVRLGSRE
jgi:hypothetical protein